MDKVLVLGSSGFIGKNLVDRLRFTGIDTIASSNRADADEMVDLNAVDSIKEIIVKHKPKMIVNCAGIVENSEKAELNYIFTKNLLSAVVQSEVDINRIVIMGSASEYGVVENPKLPVSELAALNPDSIYGKSKVKEVRHALALSSEAGISLAVARLFNPIGAGMHHRMLIPRIVNQLSTKDKNKKDIYIEVNRLDALRDYLSIYDAVAAITNILFKDNLRYDVYNVGSGTATSNRELLELIVNAFNLSASVHYLELSNIKEPTYAARADISRMEEEFKWSPIEPLASVIKEMVYNAEK